MEYVKPYTQEEIAALETKLREVKAKWLPLCGGDDPKRYDLGGSFISMEEQIELMEMDIEQAEGTFRPISGRMTTVTKVGAGS
jgi:hypothetical protein